jgi:hypothetical protein
LRARRSGGAVVSLPFDFIYMNSHRNEMHQ